MVYEISLIISLLFMLSVYIGVGVMTLLDVQTSDLIGRYFRYKKYIKIKCFLVVILWPIMLFYICVIYLINLWKS